MTEIDDIASKLPKRYEKLDLTLYGKPKTIHICRNIIRILGYPKYISLRIKGNSYIAIIASDVKEAMSFSVPKRLFASNNSHFTITSKGFVTSIYYNNKLDFDKSYLISGIYSEKENAVFFNLDDRKTIIGGKRLQDAEEKNY